MPRKMLLLLFAFGLIWGQALLAQEEEVPDEVHLALEALSDRLERDLELSDLNRFTYAEHADTSGWVCTSSRRIPENQSPPYYTVIFDLVLPDGDLGIYVYYVGRSGSFVLFCGEQVYVATATPTVDLTRTTATPTFTPSRTFTPSQTFTPTFTPSPTMTITPSFTFTPSNTPTVTPTPRADAVTCPGFLTSRLMVGEQGRVLPPDPLRLRDHPSTEGTQLATIPAEAVFDVLEGPECDPAGRAWWRVSYRNTVGWTVEGQGEDFFTEPLIGSEADVTITRTPSRTARITATSTGAAETTVTCPGFMPSRLTVGGQGRVTPGEPNNVRNAPSPSGTLVGQIDGGATFNVLEGPECDPAGRAWWRVEHDDIEGWTAEGQGDSYFVEPVATISEDASRLLTPDSP